MTNQTLLVIGMILSLVAAGATYLWRAVYGIKHKGDEEALQVLTKAQAWSSWTIPYVFIIWEGFATFILGADYKLSIGNVSIVIIFMWGFQSLVELMSAYYIVNMGKKSLKKLAK